MATGALIPVEEYLRTSYSPDCDFVDGEVLERNVGERKHGKAQRNIILYLCRRYPHLEDRVLPEQRLQVTATRFRVADVCIASANAPDEEVLHSPPDLCVEILSPEDRMNRIMERVREYFEMGVPVCWIVDPFARAAWTATPGHLVEATDGILHAGEIQLPVAEVFAKI